MHETVILFSEMMVLFLQKSSITLRSRCIPQVVQNAGTWAQNFRHSLRNSWKNAQRQTLLLCSDWHHINFDYLSLTTILTEVLFQFRLVCCYNRAIILLTWYSEVPSINILFHFSYLSLLFQSHLVCIFHTKNYAALCEIRLCTRA